MSDVDSGNNLTEENKKEEEEPLAILNLEIEKGVIKQIKLYKNSNSEEVAYNFCKENNIDFSLLNQIKNEIDSLMQKYFKLPPEGKNSQENLLQKNDSNDNENSKNKQKFLSSHPLPAQSLIKAEMTSGSRLGYS